MERKALILTFFFLSLCLYSQCYQAVKTNQSNNNGCTIALQTDGSLWSWGYNESGALGTGTSTVPFVYFSKSQIGTSTDWSSKFSVNSHVLALKNDGTLWVWGSNFYGQCGNGTSNNNVLEPQQLGNDVWLNVAAGSTYSLAVKSDGTLWAWGSNLHGQLGNGTVISSTIPIQIGASTNWEKVFSNDRTSYAIKTDGTLWSWGLNSFGLLGRTTGTFNIPSQIGTSDNWKTISPSVEYTTAIKLDGTLWVWGRSTDASYIGYYGNGFPDTNTYENNPTQMGFDTDWQSISSSQFGSLAIKNNGTLWGWGKNQYGELGDGTAITKYFPIQLDNSNDWIHVVSYIIYINVYAIKQNHSLYKWGALSPFGPLSLSTPSLFGIECSLNFSSYNKSDLVQAYPNPTNDFLTIHFEKSLSQEPELVIMNSVGQRISNYGFDFQKYKSEIRIDMRDFTSGLYCVTLKSGSQQYSVKVCKI